MDVATTLTIVLPLATLAGGWSIGRRGLSRQTIDLLQIQVDVLTQNKAAVDAQVLELQSKVNILESMVTQKAEVAEVREIVTRIAEKVGA